MKLCKKIKIDVSRQDTEALEFMQIPIPFSKANSMQQIVTAKLKLITTTEQFQALRQTQLAYRDALNAVSHYAFEHSKTSSVMALHRGMYAQLRTRYRLPSQLACSVERQVATTYKGLWTRLKKNAEHRRKKITKKRFKGLDKPPKYSSPTVQYTYERDYTFKLNQQVSVGTLNGRISIPYQGYDKHIALIQHGSSIKGMQSCGGVQMQASGPRSEDIDYAR